MDQIAGFQALPREQVQTIRILLVGQDASDVEFRGTVYHKFPDTGLHLGVNEWHRIAFVHNEDQRGGKFALWKKYKTRGLIVIGVNDESDPDTARAFATDNISYPVLL